MFVGIKYELKRKAVNEQLGSLGCAVMLQGTTSYYFKNPIVALSVKQYLNRKNTNFKYDLTSLSKEQIEGKTLIKTYEDFLEFANSKQPTMPTEPAKEEMGE